MSNIIQNNTIQAAFAIALGAAASIAVVEEGSRVGVQTPNQKVAVITAIGIATLVGVAACYKQIKATTAAAFAAVTLFVGACATQTSLAQEREWDINVVKGLNVLLSMFGWTLVPNNGPTSPQPSYDSDGDGVHF